MPCWAPQALRGLAAFHQGPGSLPDLTNWETSENGHVVLLPFWVSFVFHEGSKSRQESVGFKQRPHTVVVFLRSSEIGVPEPVETRNIIFEQPLIVCTCESLLISMCFG